MKKAQEEGGQDKKAIAVVQRELAQLLAQVNAFCKAHKTSVYSCWECGRVGQGTGDFLPTSKWGYDREFCPACIRHCDPCDADYVDSMAYRHEDCRMANPDHMTDRQKAACDERDRDSVVYRLTSTREVVSVSISSSDSEEDQPPQQSRKVGVKRKRPSQPIVID
jgi:hypothetical protein